MGKVGGNAGGVDDIVESQLINERGGLEEQREGLFCLVVSDCFL